MLILSLKMAGEAWLPGNPGVKDDHGRASRLEPLVNDGSFPRAPVEVRAPSRLERARAGRCVIVAGS